jgi:1-acyl-sn-glycerol-3-phosphate acyltransferase
MNVLEKNIREKYKYDLAQSDTYHTPENKKKKFIINSSLSCYFNLIKVILWSNIKARQGKLDSYNWAEASFKVMEAFEKVGVKFHISGMKSLEKFEGPAVFIGNHMSSLETMALPHILQPLKPVVYVMKKELTDYPVFGRITMARFPIVVGRENPREDLKVVMEEGKNRLEEGRSIIIFPQKTRSHYLDPKAFNTLGIKLAKNSNVHVVPMALISDVWGMGKLVKDFGKIDPSKDVYISFGEPFKVEGKGTEEHQHVINFIKTKWIEWGRKDYIVE